MKPAIWTYIVLLLFLSAFRCALGQERTAKSSEEFVIDYIDIRKGLLSNFVTRTVSDDNNLKYFATEGGISRYDGYTFKNYRPGKEYPELINENIETLFKDKEGNIWIGTKSGGVSVLDIKANSIKSYNHVFKTPDQQYLRIISINQDDKGNIWVGTWSKGTFVLDIKKQKLAAHFPSTQPVYKIIRDIHANMWYITGKNLQKYDPSESRLYTFQTNHVIYDLAHDTKRNKIWMVGNVGRKVNLESFDLTKQTVTSELIDLEATFVKSIALDEKSRVWLGSWGDGLYISDSTVTRFKKINTSPQTTSSTNVNHSMIVDISIDHNGIAWLSTAYGGVLILYPNKGFNFISNTNSFDVDQNSISIHKRSAGNLLIGTLSGGLYQRSRGGAFEKISQVANTRVNAIYEKGNTLFVGTNKGLYIVTNGNFSSSRRYFANDKVTAIHLDGQNNLWIGTQQKGLKVTHFPSDPNLEQCQVYAEEQKGNFLLENNRITQIKEDTRGNIWLATYSGLNLFNRATSRFIPHTELFSKQLPSVIINALYISKNTLYLATPLGLADVTFQQNKLRFNALYNTQAGLSNDFIYAIEKSKHGHLWLSTATTISSFNPQTKSFINYDREDGVMVNSFHIGSSFVDSDGQMYFGGANGVIQFMPDNVSTSFSIPSIVWTKLMVNNHGIEEGEEVDGNVILTNNIEYTNEINLSYKQSNFALSFAANDFFGADNVNYTYKLQGFQDRWVNIGRKNEINFTGLRYGTYELIVKASRNKQNWGPEKTIRITVGVPPWLSWYAFTFYAFLITGILMLVRKISIRQAQLKAGLQIVQIEKEKEHALHEAKINFFTNISHEFRTPLTLIMSPVAEILDDLSLNEAIREKMILVEANAKRMLNLINQLLDFRKSEHGLLKLKRTHGDFLGFTQEVFLSFQTIARKKDIQYVFKSNLEAAVIDFDHDQMEIVLCNLLSNAFKYTQEGGSIHVRVYKNRDFLAIDVQDNGIGLSDESITNIFDRFYQVQNAQTAKMVGSGIGLAFSKNIIELHDGEISVKSDLGKGTCFTVLLPAKIAEGHRILMPEPLEEFSVEDATPATKTSLHINRQNTLETLLIVDDNEDIRSYLNSLLKDGFNILEAENGLEALTIANRELPDLIISDVMMPEMDGITLCQEIKSQLATSHIPIILLTARSSVVYELNGLKTGADDYITKPFNPIIIKIRIRNILENRKKLREYFFNKVRFEPDTDTVAEVDLDSIFIDKAINLVNENLHNEAFGIEDMVEQLFMSQSTLYRKIKSLTSLSLTGFIRSIRLKKAAQLILQTQMKLSQVAFEVGFNDYKYFRKSFQQQFGCLPSDYRAKILENSSN